jgi:hypothetical protein
MDDNEAAEENDYVEEDLDESDAGEDDEEDDEDLDQQLADIEDDDVEVPQEEDLEEIDEPGMANLRPAPHEFTIHNTSSQDEHIRFVTVVPADQRVTSEVIQLEELCEVIGVMISAIEHGAPVTIPTEGMTRSIDIARMVVLCGRAPLKVRRVIERRINEDIVEDWKVSEMTIPLINVRYLRSLLNRQRASNLAQEVVRRAMGIRSGISPADAITSEKTKSAKT